MLRLHRFLPLILLGLALVLPTTTFAEDPPAAEPPAPVFASDDLVTELLVQFKDEYKARGLKGEDKLLQRDFAMSQLSKFQHPAIVEALIKVTKSSDRTLRTLAVIYLGQQTLLPAMAGPAILKVMKKDAKQPICVITGLQSMGNLKFLGAADKIKALLEHRDFAVKKAAIQSVGDIGEMRLWKEIFKLGGVSVRTGEDAEAGIEQGGSKEEVVEEGYSYEGAEAKVDWGMSDNTAENAEAKRQVEAKIAANKAAAMAKAGAGGGGGGGGVGGGSAGRGGVARDPKELLPFVLRTIHQLTGEKFSNSKELAQWVRKNRQDIRDREKALDKVEKAQKEEAKDQKKAAKSHR